MVARIRAVRGRARLWAADARDRLLGRRPPFTPPRRMQSVGAGNYAAIGEEFLGHFVELGGLAPSDRVLDIGCGTGRMAVPLMGFLNEGVAYRGFDVGRAEIRWCRRQITHRAPAFEFECLDVANDLYNPGGRIDPRMIVLPYDDASFDFTFATSVFTHMRPAEIDRYAAEISRTLTSSGRALLTFFLLDDGEGRTRETEKSLIRFSHDGEGFRAAGAERPEEAIAYPTAAVREVLSRNRLHLVEPIHYGSWASGSWVGDESAPSFQDIVVVSAGSPAPRLGT